MTGREVHYEADIRRQDPLPKGTRVGDRVQFAEGEPVWTVESVHSMGTRWPWAWLVLAGTEEEAEPGHIRFPIEPSLTRQQRRALLRKQAKVRKRRR